MIGKVGKSNGEARGRRMQPGNNQSACNRSEILAAVDPATKSYKEITMETGRIGKTSKRSRYAAWGQSKRMRYNVDSRNR